MRRLGLAELLAREPLILTEGAVIERLGRAPSISLDPHVLHARLAADERGRRVLGDLYRGYLDVARRHALPMVVLTPTWRASAARVERAGLGSVERVNREACDWLAGLAAAHDSDAAHDPDAAPVCIGGLMGCIGDAYRPQEALSEEEAAAAHGPQARALAAAGVDFLLTSTLPALSEALGLAEAMAAAATVGRGLPYVLSFVVRPAGTLLDGTPLHRAVRRIDARVSPRPLCYLLNCVHPTVYAQAMEHELALDRKLCDRVIGLQGNTSCRAPEELDGLSYLETEEPQPFADAMLDLLRHFGARVLGGCCGTDERHIEWIARGMAREKRRLAGGRAPGPNM